MQGLRERKKADTRAAIRAAAVDLFVAQGFEDTTMDAVADAADVSVRTVFRYFPTKEDLVFGEAEERVGAFGELLEARTADEPVMAALRAVASEVATQMAGGQELDARMAVLLPDEPALRRRYLEIMDRIEETVAGWAARRLGAGPDDLRPRLLAAAVIATQRVVVDAMIAGNTRSIADLVEEAMDTLGKGFDHLD